MMKLVLVMPATNACSERSFMSAMRHLITKLRSSMGQSRLNHFCSGGEHQQIVLTERLTPPDCENERVKCCRRETFCSKAKKHGASRDVHTSSRMQYFSR